MDVIHSDLIDFTKAERRLLGDAVTVYHDNWEFISAALLPWRGPLLLQHLYTKYVIPRILENKLEASLSTENNNKSTSLSSSSTNTFNSIPNFPLLQKTFPELSFHLGSGSYRQGSNVDTSLNESNINKTINYTINIHTNYNGIDYHLRSLSLSYLQPLVNGSINRINLHLPKVINSMNISNRNYFIPVSTIPWGIPPIMCMTTGISELLHQKEISPTTNENNPSMPNSSLLSFSSSASRSSNLSAVATTTTLPQFSLSSTTSGLVNVQHSEIPNTTHQVAWWNQFLHNHPTAKQKVIQSINETQPEK